MVKKMEIEIFNTLLDRYKDILSKSFLRNAYCGQYAFVGIGGHSLANLYPAIEYLQIPLKYICCRSAEKAELVQAKYKGIKATTSLAEVLADGEVRGVFVSATPQAHCHIAEQVISCGKNLFIEKPPCLTLGELKHLRELAVRHRVVAMAGLQKRYAPVVDVLRRRLPKERLISYRMSYLTGLYPEGNPVMELFIHPIDFLVFLFGKAEIIGRECVKSRRGGITVMLILRHEKVSGTVELSTDYSWNGAAETFFINTERGVYEARNMESLAFSPKSGSLFGIPLEKVRTRHPVSIDLLRRNSFMPTLANNPIHLQGFLNEIKAFADTVEHGNLLNRSPFDSLQETYRLLEQISFTV